MDGEGLLLLMGLGVLGLILAGVVIGCVAAAIVRKKKKYLWTAIICVCSYVLFFCGVFGIRALQVQNLKNMPQLHTEADRVTILNAGTGSMGSMCRYALSAEGILEEIEQPEYRVGMNMRFGYTFQAKKQGELYIGVVEMDCGKTAYIDFYKVNVNQENRIEAEKVKQIRADEYGRIMEELPEEFAFVKNAME